MRAPYIIKRVGTACAAFAFAFGISYLGIPPEKKVLVVTETPVKLKMEKQDYQSPQDFASATVFYQGKEYCKISSTTAVRVFDGSREYKERTRIERDACALPKYASTLEIKIEFPYKPEQQTISTNLECAEFKGEGSKWNADCMFTMTQNMDSLSFQAFEHLDDKMMAERAKIQGKYQLKADLIQILLAK